MGIVIAELCEFAEWLNPTVLIKGSMPIPREVSVVCYRGWSHSACSSKA